MLTFTFAKFRSAASVLEVTQTHIHIHTHTFTPWRVPRGGGLEGRHAHGELEAHGGSGEEYGSCVRENDGCRDSRAMVCNPSVSRGIDGLLGSDGGAL